MIKILASFTQIEIAERKIQKKQKTVSIRANAVAVSL